MIVVDTNVIGYLFLSSERSQQAEKALLKDSEWAAPMLWRSELRSVLASYLCKKHLSLKDGLQVMEEAGRLMRDREFHVPSLNVLSLVAESNCSAYDCEFISLAQDLNIPLVTVDKQVLDQFPQIAISLEQFVKG